MIMTKNKLYHMVLAGILCAIGIVVPMFMPRIVLGPMSFTLASHVAVFLGMFISPAVAVAVCIGTTIGFFGLPRRQSLHCVRRPISGSRSSVQPISSAIRISSTARLKHRIQLDLALLTLPPRRSSLRGTGNPVCVPVYFGQGLSNGFVASVASAGWFSARSFTPCWTTLFPPGLEAVCTASGSCVPAGLNPLN